MKIELQLLVLLLQLLVLVVEHALQSESALTTPVATKSNDAHKKDLRSLFMKYSF